MIPRHGPTAVWLSASKHQNKCLHHHNSVFNRHFFNIYKVEVLFELTVKLLMAKHPQGVQANARQHPAALDGETLRSI